MKMIARKIILVGDFATGKTSLIRRFVDNQFSDTYLSTIGVKISKKIIPLTDETVQGLIWDIEGGTQNKPVNVTYFTGAHGAILVADITREETIAHLSDYLDMVRRRISNIPVVLVLNKCDKIDEALMRKTESQVLREFGSDADGLFLTSAKTGEGVEEMFYALAERMLG